MATETWNQAERAAKAMWASGCTISQIARTTHKLGITLPEVRLMLISDITTDKIAVDLVMLEMEAHHDTVKSR
jgi:hypothetical protein